jgi:hypothetical protein
MMDLLNSFILTNPIACTFFRTKDTIQSKHSSTKISANQDMNDSQENYIYDDEGKIFGMGVGATITESNGHGEDKEESMNLIETIKSLQRYMQSYKIDNERLMKDK